MIEKFKRNQITPDTHEISLKINEIIDWIEIHKVITGGQHNSLDLIYKRIETLEDKLNSCISLGELGLIKERLDNLEKSFCKPTNENIFHAIATDLKNMDDRLHALQGKAILKPDYDPKDVAFKSDIPLKEILHAIIDDVAYLYKEMEVEVEPCCPIYGKDNEVPEPNEKLKEAFDKYHELNKPRLEFFYKTQTEQLEKLGLAAPATKGTFEWALIQLKAGKSVKRRAQESFMCIYMDCNNELNQFNGKGVTSHDRIDWKMLLENDWEIVE